MYFLGRQGAYVLLGEVGGLHTSRGCRGLAYFSGGGRGPTYFSGCRELTYFSGW